MSALASHGLDADGTGSVCSIQNLPIGAVGCKDAFRWCGSGVVIDVFRRGETVPDFLKNVCQVRLVDGRRENRWVAEEQPLILVQLNIGKQYS